MDNLGVIVPFYNEKNTLAESIERLLTQNIFSEIILSDDNSNDGSDIIAKHYQDKNQNIKYIKSSTNKGKGNAVIEGLKISNGDYIIIQDADLEYDPKDIEKFLIKIKKNQADCIMGSRFTGNERSVLNFWHMIGNKFITVFFNFMNNTAFTDIYCCYCLFHRNLQIQNF